MKRYLLIILCFLTIFCKTKDRSSISNNKASSHYAVLADDLKQAASNYRSERGERFLREYENRDIDAAAFNLSSAKTSDLAVLLNDPQIKAFISNTQDKGSLSLAEADQGTAVGIAIGVFTFAILLEVGSLKYLTNKASQEALESVKKNHQREISKLESDQANEIQRLNAQLKAEKARISDVTLESQARTSSRRQSQSQFEERIQILTSQLKQERLQNADLASKKLEIEASHELMREQQQISIQELNEARQKVQKIEADLRKSGVNRAEIERQLREANTNLTRSQEEVAEVTKKLTASSEALQKVEATSSNLTQRVASLEGELTIASQTNSRLNSNLLQAKARTQKVQANLDETRQSLQAAETSNLQANEIASSLRSELETMRGQLNTTTQQNHALTQDLRGAQDSLGRVNTVMEGLGEQLQRSNVLSGNIAEGQEGLVSKITSLRDSLSQYNVTNNQDLKRKVGEWQSALDNSIAEGERLKGQLSQLQASLNASLDSKANLERELQATRSSLSQAQAKSRSLQLELQRLRRSNQGVLATNSKLSAQIKATEGKLEASQARVRQMEESMRTLDSEIDKANTRSTELGKQLQAASKENLKISQANAILQGQVQNATDSLVAASEQNKLLTTRLQETRVELEGARTRYNAIQVELERVQAQIAEARTAGVEIDRLTSEYVALQDQALNLKGDLAVKEVAFRQSRGYFLDIKWRILHDQTQELSLFNKVTTDLTGDFRTLTFVEGDSSFTLKFKKSAAGTFASEYYWLESLEKQDSGQVTKTENSKGINKTNLEDFRSSLSGQNVKSFNKIIDRLGVSSTSHTVASDYLFTVKDPTVRLDELRTDLTNEVKKSANIVTQFARSKLDANDLIEYKLGGLQRLDDVSRARYIENIGGDQAIAELGKTRQQILSESLASAGINEGRLDVDYDYGTDRTYQSLEGSAKALETSRYEFEALEARRVKAHARFSKGVEAMRVKAPTEFRIKGIRLSEDGSQSLFEILNSFGKRWKKAIRESRD